jgi:F5/8 type C domain/Major tropism determinant N-terminal domain
MAFQFRRGTEAQRTSTGITPASGELIHCTDSGAWYAGDGVTDGGRALPGAIGQQLVTAPTADGVLAFDPATGQWLARLNLAGFGDVSGTPYHDDLVVWDDAEGSYRHGLPNLQHRPVLVTADATPPQRARVGTLWTRGPVSNGLFFCIAEGPPATWERIAYASEFTPVVEIPIASITYTQSSVYAGTTPISNAIMTDGSFTNTGVATDADGAPEYITMDLGSVYDVGSVVIGTATDNIPGGWDKFYTQGLDVEFSANGTTWTYVFNSGTMESNGMYTFPVDISARYIRIVSNSGTLFYVALSEFYALAPGQTWP